jgi:CheY-like chemotaxis protein
MHSPKMQKLTDMAQKQGHPFRVLIVDDERWVREVFRDYCALTKAFEIDLAHSGEEAIRMAAATRYDLITMDLIMPEVSGLEALGAIKRASPQTPVMVVTGNATDKLVHEAGVQGASGVLYKPILLEDFISALVDRLDR